MNPSDDLRSRLLGDVPPEVVDAINEANSKGLKELAPTIYDVMMTTDHHGIRDVAALAMRDLEYSDAVEGLVQLIKDPKTYKHRGALVYALEPFSKVELIPFLIDLVIEANFEVRNVATIVIDNVEGTMSDKDWAFCIQKLEAAIPHCIEPDRRELLTYIRSLFEPEEPSH